MNLTTANKILVITKFRYLGDTIIATPVFRRLKEALPEAEITLLSGPAMPTLLQGCPYLAAIHPFDPKAPARIRRNRQLIAHLRRQKFDAALLLNRSLHSALVAWAARIPQRIGFDTEYRGPLLTKRVAYRWDRPDRDCAFDLLHAVEIAAEPALPELWVTEAEREEARQRLASCGIGKDDLLIGMQPGAHDPEVREWGAERFAEVADRLSQDHRARIVLLGSREERPLSDRVAKAMKVPPAVLTGETSLRQALAVIAQCRIWIGNDSGLLHAAVGLGPATVGIYGHTKAPRWGYHTPRHITVTVTPEPSGVDAASIRRGLDAISVDTVHGFAASLLDDKARMYGQT